MSKKGENIYKRKDGRWEARYIRGYQPDGKAIYGYCYAATYAGAKEKSNLMKAGSHKRHRHRKSGKNAPFMPLRRVAYAP